MGKLDSTRHEIVVVTVGSSSGWAGFFGSKAARRCANSSCSPPCRAVYRSSSSSSPSPPPPTPPLSTAKTSQNRNQIHLKVSTRWFKWRLFVSLRSGEGGGLKQTNRARLLTSSSTLTNLLSTLKKKNEGAELPVYVACLCAHIHDRADEKRPRPCNTT